MGFKHLGIFIPPVIPPKERKNHSFFNNMESEMDFTKLQFIIFCLWVFCLGHANETVTIIDKDGEITICQVMENGVIVCL